MPAVNWYIQNPENLSDTIIVSTPETTPKLETPLAGFFYSAPEVPVLLEEHNKSLLYSTNMIAKYCKNCGSSPRSFSKFRAIDKRHLIMLGLNYCEQIYFYKILDTRTEIVDSAPKNLLQSQYDEYARYILSVADPAVALTISAFSCNPDAAAPKIITERPASSGVIDAAVSVYEPDAIAASEIDRCSVIADRFVTIWKPEVMSSRIFSPPPSLNSIRLLLFMITGAEIAAVPLMITVL